MLGRLDSAVSRTRALDLSAKLIELLKDMVGGLSRVALLVNAGEVSGPRHPWGFIDERLNASIGTLLYWFVRYNPGLALN